MAEDQVAATQENSEQDQQPAFGIEKIYVKDLSLEIPNAPQIFIQREAPQVSIELGNSTSMLEEGVFEVVITVTVTSKIEDKTVFLVEVAQAGIFQIRNVPAENNEKIAAVNGAATGVLDSVTARWPHSGFVSVEPYKTPACRSCSERRRLIAHNPQ